MQQSMSRLAIDTDRLTRIKRQVSKLVDQQQFSSVEWVITHKRRSVEQGRYGFADAHKQTPLPDEPIYRIYSMTKPVVSVAALRLIEAGDLILSAPVATYLPEFKTPQILNNGKTQPAHRIMTVEHLLTHRSGISYDFLPACEVAACYRSDNLIAQGDVSLAEFVQQLASYPLAFEPGTEWRYSYSTDVLARVLEVVCDKPLAEVLDELIFTPCGMRQTGFRIGRDEQTRLLPLFGKESLLDAREPDAGPNVLEIIDASNSHPIDSAQFARGGHGLYSTTSDYLRFMHVLYDGLSLDGETLLSAPMVDMMWRDRIPESQQPLVISGEAMGGYGWTLFGRTMNDTGQAAFLTMPGEGGWSGAAATYFWVDRVNEFGGLVMTQYMGSTVPLGEMVRATAYQSLVADNTA